jgi:peptide deformylase
LVCINPKIIKFSKTKKWLDGEGCLSVRWYYGKVLRSTNVTLEYYDEKGQKQIRGAGGLLAHIFQHECDHLMGELFIDKAKDIEYIEPEEINLNDIKDIKHE